MKESETTQVVLGSFLVFEVMRCVGFREHIPSVHFIDWQVKHGREPRGMATSTLTTA